MNKILLTALREYSANVKTKTFWLSLLSFPIILAVAAMLPMWLAKKKEAREYSVIDRSGWVLENIQDTLNSNAKTFLFTPADASDPDIENKLNSKVRNGKLFAYFIIGPDPISGNEGCRYVSINLTDTQLQSWFSSVAGSAITQKRMEQKGIDPALVAWIRQPLKFEGGQVQEAGDVKEVKETDILRQWAPTAFMYLLWISIMMLSQMLLMSTIEEKSDRTAEVLLSSMSPDQLMIGKILGSTATGLSVILTWIICIIAGLKFLPRLYGDIPDIDFSLIMSEPAFLAAFLFYFLTGFLLYSALLSGIGSVCSTIKEAQNLWTPLMFVLIVPLLLMTEISRDPNSTIARVMSYVPFWTPFTMMNRAGGPPPMTDYILTTVILLVSLAGAFWAAGKIFGIGILMTGQPPKLMQLLKWLKKPD